MLNDVRIVIEITGFYMLCCTHAQVKSSPLTRDKFYQAPLFILCNVEELGGAWIHVRLGYWRLVHEY